MMKQFSESFCIELESKDLGSVRLYVIGFSISSSIELMLDEDSYKLLIDSFSAGSLKRSSIAT